VLGPSHAVIGGLTVSQGAASTLVANTPISLSSSVLVVGSSTAPLQQQPQAAATPATTIGGQAIVLNPLGGLGVGDSSVLAGAKATVHGTVISAPQSGGAVIGVNAIPPPSPQPLSLAPVPLFTVGSSSFVESPSSFQIGNTILSQGAAVTIANTPVSLGSNGLVIGFKTIPPGSLNGVHSSDGSPSAFIVGGSTISAGGSGITVKGTSLSLGFNGLLVGGSTVTIPPGIPLPTVAGQQFETALNGNIILGGSTITAGGSATTMEGSTLSVLPSGSGIVVNGQSTIPIPKPPIVAGQEIYTVAGGPVVIGSQTLNPGAQASIAGTAVSILPNGRFSVAGSTVPFAFFSPFQASQQGVRHPLVFSVDGTALTEGLNAVTVHGTRLSLRSEGLEIGSSMVPFASLHGVQPVITNPQVYSIDNTAVAEGASPVNVHGTRVSLGPSGLLIVGSSTMHIPSATTPLVGQSITAAPSGGFLIAGNTLTPGQVITISGMPISLGPSSNLVIVRGTRTIDLASAPSPSIFDVAGQIFTAVQGGFAIEGTSLYPGQVTIISGTQISLNPMGLVIGSKTDSLPSSSIFAVDGQTITANANGYSIAGTEVSFGGAVTISSVPISLGTTGAVVIGTDTMPLAFMAPVSSPSISTAYGQVFTKNGSRYSVDGTELPSSGVTTPSGHTIPTVTPGIVVNSSTLTLSSISAPSSAAATTSKKSGQNRVRVEKSVIMWFTMMIMAIIGLGML